MDSSNCNCSFPTYYERPVKKHDGRSKDCRYRISTNMVKRCYKESDKDFIYYGGRGIFVCQQWLNDPLVFFEDIGSKPDGNLSLDRVNNERGYCPHNIRWATHSLQQKNKTIKPGPGVRLRGFSYIAEIGINNTFFHIGSFKSYEDALSARLVIEKEWYGILV